MRCPQCGERETRVVDSRDLDDSATIRRRRECAACSMRFTTYERVEAARLVVIKRDGSRQEFDRERLDVRPAQGPDPSAGSRRRGRDRRGRDRGGASRRRRDRGAVVADRRARDGAAPRHRSDRLHPVRQRLPELRGPRGAQARGRHAVRRARRAGHRHPLEDHEALAADERPVGPRHPGGTRRRRRSDRPIRPARSPALVGRPPPRQELPRLPQQPLSVHRRPRPATRPDRAADRRRRTSRSSSIPANSCSARRSNGSSSRTTSSSRLEGKSSLGRLGLLIHSTAGYVDPGWKGNLTLELSNVANLPIALYFGMRIGQISFFRDVESGRAAVRLARARVEVPGPVGADCVGVPPRLRGRTRREDASSRP